MLVSHSNLSGYVQALQFTSASEDCSLHLWDLRGQAPLATSTEHTDGVLCVEWMGQGVVMTGSKDTTVKSCSIRSGKDIQSSQSQSSLYSIAVMKIALMASDVSFLLHPQVTYVKHGIVAKVEYAFSATCHV